MANDFAHRTFGRTDPSPKLKKTLIERYGDAWREYYDSMSRMAKAWWEKFVNSKQPGGSEVVGGSGTIDDTKSTAHHVYDQIDYVGEPGVSGPSEWIKFVKEYFGVSGSTSVPLDTIYGYEGTPDTVVRWQGKGIMYKDLSGNYYSPRFRRHMLKLDSIANGY